MPFQKNKYKQECDHCNKVTEKISTFCGGHCGRIMTHYVKTYLEGGTECRTCGCPVDLICSDCYHKENK